MHGQPVNSVLNGVLPIHIAASSGNDLVVQMLIDAGADVNAARLVSERTLFSQSKVETLIFSRNSASRLPGSLASTMPTGQKQSVVLEPLDQLLCTLLLQMATHTSSRFSSRMELIPMRPRNTVLNPKISLGKLDMSMSLPYFGYGTKMLIVGNSPTIRMGVTSARLVASTILLHLRRVAAVTVAMVEMGRLLRLPHQYTA